MEAVLVTAYFVVLAWAIAATVLLRRIDSNYSATLLAHDEERQANREWTQKLAVKHDEELREKTTEAFNAGRKDLLAEFKQRVDRGELAVKVLSDPKQQ